MSPGKIVVKVEPRIRRRWMLRLGMWLASKAYVEVVADGHSLGKHRILDGAEWVESE